MSLGIAVGGVSLTDGAKSYLARQTNLSPAEINARIDQASSQITQATIQARQATAGILQTTGWSLFGVLLLSLLGAVSGGLVGVIMNRRIPLSGKFSIRSADPAYQ